jgi:hypothetical protein
MPLSSPVQSEAGGEQQTSTEDLHDSSLTDNNISVPEGQPHDETMSSGHGLVKRQMLQTQPVEPAADSCTDNTALPKPSGKAGERAGQAAAIIESLQKKGTPAAAYKVAENDDDIVLDAAAFTAGPASPGAADHVSSKTGEKAKGPKKKGLDHETKDKHGHEVPSEIDNDK